MAHLADDRTYAVSEVSSELMNRPDRGFAVHDQADFLGLALKLHVPIFNNAAKIPLPAEASKDGSFTFEVQPERDFINGANTRWFRSREKSKTGSVRMRYVTKRIVDGDDQEHGDANRLATAANEMRALAVSEVHKHRNLINLFAVAWDAPTAQGRYWPTLFIEATELSTLEVFIRSKRISMPTKLLFGLEMLAGVGCLHARGIVHGDLRPGNIIVFPRPKNIQEARDLGRFNFDAFTIKICNFDRAVFVSDYADQTEITMHPSISLWTSPELGCATRIVPNLLYTCDVYSVGLILASMLLDGSPLFPDLRSGAITDLKVSNQACTYLLENIRTETPASNHLTSSTSIINDAMTRNFFPQILQSNSQSRMSLTAAFTYLKLWTVLSALSTMNQMTSTKIEPSSRATVSSPTSKTNNSASKSASGLDSESLMYAVGRLEQRARDIFSCISCWVGFSVNRSYVNLHSSQVSEDIVTTILGGDTSSPALDEFESSQCIPDLGFEYGYQLAELSQYGAHEVFDAMISRVNTGRDCSPEVLYQVSGCYFNGLITPRDSNRAMKYFSRAATERYLPALHTVSNVLESGSEVFPSSFDHTFEDLDEAGFYSILVKLKGATCTPQLPSRICPSQIYLQRWIQRFPQTYFRFIKSRSWLSLQHSMLRNFNGPRSRLIEYHQQASLSTLQNGLQGTLGGFTPLQEAVLSGSPGKASSLLQDADIKLDDCGTSPGWTPLWLACFTGQFQLAKSLVKAGASLDCCDTTTGFTLLHILNQFSEKESVEWFVENLCCTTPPALAIDVSCNAGMTPLHATFLGWDFSAGATAQILLANGANPMAEAPDTLDVMTPIGLSALTLNHTLLGNMITASKTIPNRRENELSKAKAQAYRALLGVTEFEFRSKAGKDWKNSLKRTLQLIVDDDMRHEFGSCDLVKRGSDLLQTAIGSGKPYLAEILLDLLPYGTHKTDKDASLFHYLIQRRMNDLIVPFISKGGSILGLNKLRENALHIAAQHNPQALSQLIDNIDLMRKSDRGEQTTKQILELTSVSGLNTVELLIMMGSQERIAIAEELRCRYDLDLDAMHIQRNGTKLTLLGSLIMLNSEGTTVPISQVGYLLDLTPTPKFVCTGSGLTLLHLAIRGRWAYSSNYEGHQICKMVLDKFLDTEDLTGTHLTTALNVATFWANKTGIKMIKQRVEGTFDFAELINSSGNLAPSIDYVLDYLRKTTGPDAEAKDLATPQRRESSLTCYKILREYGALHDVERKGYFVGNHGLFASLISEDDWIDLVNSMATYLGLSRPVFDPDIVILEYDKQDPEIQGKIRKDPALANEVFVARFVELVWRFDSFSLRSYHVKCPKVDGERQLAKLQASRKADRSHADIFTNISQEDIWAGRFLWSFDTYVQVVPVFDRANPSVTWKRPGKVWSWEEVQQFTARFVKSWDLRTRYKK